MANEAQNTARPAGVEPIPTEPSPAPREGAAAFGEPFYGGAEEPLAPAPTMGGDTTAAPRIADEGPVSPEPTPQQRVAAYPEPTLHPDATPYPDSIGDNRPHPAGEARHHAEPFVRERRPHHTQPPVDDLQDDDLLENDYATESGYTLPNRRPMSSRTYRRSRSNVSKVKKELKYGQYLSVPKGSREIFSSRDRTRHRQLMVAAIAAVAIAIVVIVFLVLPK